MAAEAGMAAVVVAATAGNNAARTETFQILKNRFAAMQNGFFLGFYGLSLFLTY